MPDKLTDSEIVNNFCELCGDNRFELIEKYKNELLEHTNIDTAKDEMAVIDSILFRFWQMGWLDKLEQFDRLQAENERLKDDNEYLQDRRWKELSYVKAEAYKEFAERLKERKYLDETGWSHGEHPYIVEEDDIDDVLEELAGDDK